MQPERRSYRLATVHAYVREGVTGLPSSLHRNQTSEPANNLGLQALADWLARPASRTCAEERKKCASSRPGRWTEGLAWPRPSGLAGGHHAAGQPCFNCTTSTCPWQLVLRLVHRVLFYLLFSTESVLSGRLQQPSGLVLHWLPALHMQATMEEATDGATMEGMATCHIVQYYRSYRIRILRAYGAAQRHSTGTDSLWCSSSTGQLRHRHCRPTSAGA